ncbi:MAG: amino acid ABC transporter substrate-binding protein [Betaproteobacteria bacterium]
MINIKKIRQSGVQFLLVLASLTAMLGVSSVFAQSKPPIKIGFTMPLTGGLAGNGKAALLAMNIWKDDINAKGGLLGRPVDFVYYDDQTNPSLVLGLYTKLLESDKVDLIVSSYGTNMQVPPLPMVMQRKLYYLCLFGLNSNANFGYNGYFQMQPNGPDPAVDNTGTFFEAAMQASPRPKTVAIVGGDAEYPAMAMEGARTNIQRLGLKIVYDKTYAPSTTDYAPIMRAIQATKPDIVMVASYPPDSVGMIRAANEVGLKAQVFGGPMIGTAYASVKKQLGPLLNGVVGFEEYVPEPTIKFGGVEKFLERYQVAAVKEGVDPLGFYIPPFAYAMMQILSEAVEKTQGLDHQKLIAYTHATTFKTYAGDIKFGANGEWAYPRSLYVQYRNIEGNDTDQFKKAGKQIILAPAQFKSGNIISPYDPAASKK